MSSEFSWEIWVYFTIKTTYIFQSYIFAEKIFFFSFQWYFHEEKPDMLEEQIKKDYVKIDNDNNNSGNFKRMNIMHKTAGDHKNTLITKNFNMSHFKCSN